MFLKDAADEAADIIDELEDDKAEILLKEMEAESSKEVRNYSSMPILSGSLMTTDIFLSVLIKLPKK